MAKVHVIRRLAADILKCGRVKVWLDPNEKEKIGAATSREQIRKLIEENLIIKKLDHYNSRAKSRKIKEGKKKGKRSGLGKRHGTKNARLPEKTVWMKKIRSMRKALKAMKVNGDLSSEEYRTYKQQAKGNLFKSKNIMVETILKKKAEARRAEELKKQAEALSMK